MQTIQHPSLWEVVADINSAYLDSTGFHTFLFEDEALARATLEQLYQDFLVFARKDPKRKVKAERTGRQDYQYYVLVGTNDMGQKTCWQESRFGCRHLQETYQVYRAGDQIPLKFV